MRTRIVRIGKSHGVRIPAAVLEQTGLRGEVDLAVRPNAIMVRPAKKDHAGWSAAFARMRKNDDDCFVDDPPPSSTTWKEKE